MRGVVVKVWNISSATKTKGVKGQLKDSLGYILKEEKTRGVLSKEEKTLLPGDLTKELLYIENDLKTLDKAYVGSRHILSEEAKEAAEEMIRVKEFFHKEEGRAALHGVISLDETDSKSKTPGELMYLCSLVLEEVFPDHQALFAVHNNTENLHVHFLVNSVSLSGKKIHQDKNFVKEVLQPSVNKHAAALGFQVNEVWAQENRISFKEAMLRLKKDADESIDYAEDYADFLGQMIKRDYQVRDGKYPSFTPPGFHKAIRIRRLGEDYEKGEIIKKIENKGGAFKAFKVLDMDYPEKERDIFTNKTRLLKPYRELSPKEKAYCLGELKKGNNPWKARYKTLLSMEEVSQNLNRINKDQGLLSFYANDGTYLGAIDEILKQKRDLSLQAKELKEEKKAHKREFELLKEAQSLEQKAYLYERLHNQEYKKEYDRFKEITRILKEEYKKDLTEVSKASEKIEEGLLILKSEREALSDHYLYLKTRLYEKAAECTKKTEGFTREELKRADRKYETGKRHH